MPWNYRVFRLPGDADSEAYYVIRETLYRVAGEPPDGWSEQNASPLSDTVEGLKWVLEAMLHALDRPVLDAEK